MRTVIVGCGEVGSYLAKYLVEDNHNVTVIDMNGERLRALSDHIDIRTIEGSGADVAVLEEAEVGSANLLLALTNIDEINMLSCFFAKKLGAHGTISRITGKDAILGHPGFYRKHLGIDMVINPSMLAAAEATQIILEGSGSGIADFGFGRIYLRHFEVQPKAPFTRKPIKDLNLPGALLVTLIRDGELRIPHGDDVIQAGDRIYAICKPEAVQYVRKGVGEKQEHTKRVIIVGGGNIGLEIAHYFDHPRYLVKMFEDDKERAWQLASELKHVKVIDSDGGDLEVLEEEYLSSADALIASTGSDEKNLMTAVLAREHGVSRTVAVVDKPQFAALGLKLGITSALAPRILAANQVLSFVRGGNVNRIRLLSEGQAELLEFRLSERSRLAGTAIMELGLPRGLIIGGVLRGNKAIIPRGSDVLEPADTVILFATSERKAYVENLLRAEDELATEEFFATEPEL